MFVQNEQRRTAKVKLISRALIEKASPYRQKQQRSFVNLTISKEERALKASHNVKKRDSVRERAMSAKSPFRDSSALGGRSENMDIYCQVLDQTVKSQQRWNKVKERKGQIELMKEQELKRQAEKQEKKMKDKMKKQ